MEKIIDAQYIRTEKDLRFEKYMFRVNSKNWKIITVKGKKYRENTEGDIWEIREAGNHKGEQLFRRDAAIREITKAHKKIPNLIFAGYRELSGTFFDRGVFAHFLSPAKEGGNAWYLIFVLGPHPNFEL